MDRLLAYAFSLGEVNSAGRFHSRMQQLTLNTVAIYSAIWAAPNPFLRCQLSPSLLKSNNLWQSCRVSRSRIGKKRLSFLPLPSPSPLFPTLLFFLLPSSSPRPQPLTCGPRSSLR